MTFPFETIKITSIDRFCEEITAVIYDTPDSTRCVKICRTDEALRRIHVGDTVACSELGEQWSNEYTEKALKDYRAADNETLMLNAILAAANEQWCLERGIETADFSLALSMFLCDRRNDVLMHELFGRMRKARLEAKKAPAEPTDEGTFKSTK